MPPPGVPMMNGCLDARGLHARHRRDHRHRNRDRGIAQGPPASIEDGRVGVGV